MRLPCLNQRWPWNARSPLLRRSGGGRLFPLGHADHPTGAGLPMNAGMTSSRWQLAVLTAALSSCPDLLQDGMEVVHEPLLHDLAAGDAMLEEHAERDRLAGRRDTHHLPTVRPARRRA